MMNLPLSQIQDEYVRRALQMVQDAYNENEFNQGSFKLFKITIPAADSGFKFYHNLGFIPTDVVVAKESGSSFSFTYDQFTKEYIVINASGAVSIRCFIGSLGA
jgi:hypothetical protein